MKTLHKEHLSWDRLAAQHQEEEGGREGRRGERRRGEGVGRERGVRRRAGTRQQPLSRLPSEFLLQACDKPAQYPHWPRRLAASSGNHPEWGLGVCGFGFVRDGGKRVDKSPCERLLSVLGQACLLVLLSHPPAPGCPAMSSDGPKPTSGEQLWPPGRPACPRAFPGGADRQAVQNWEASPGTELRVCGRTQSRKSPEDLLKSLLLHPSKALLHIVIVCLYTPELPFLSQLSELNN